MNQFRNLLRRILTRRIFVLVVVISVLLSTTIVFVVRNNFLSNKSIAVDEVSVVVDTEIDQLIGNANATLVLGGTLIPYNGRAEILKGTSNATGLVAVTINDEPVATVLAPKSSFFELQNVPLSFRTTASSQILLTPGILTGDPLIDALLLAVTETLPETNRVEENLRREAREFGSRYLLNLSIGTKTLINEAVDALLKRLPDTLSEIIPPQNSTTTTQVPTTNTGDTSSTESSSFRRINKSAKSVLMPTLNDNRPILPPTCDIGVKNYTNLEHDNVCITLVSGGGTQTPTPTKFVIENRSPRWVLLYLDKPEISIKEALTNKEKIASSETIIPDGVIAPKEWVFPGVLDLALRFASALADSSSANVAKELLNYIPWVQIRTSDDSLAEQIELKFREFSQDFRTEIELETSLNTRMTTVTAGLPRTADYSGHINFSARDELRRLIATTGTIISTIMVPTIRVILDLPRQTTANKACTFEQKSRGPKTFVALSNFTLNNAKDIAPFAEALVGSTPDSFIDGVVKTAPNAIKAILTSSEPWSMIGYYLFSDCGKGLSAEEIGRMNATLLSVGYEPENATDIVVEYATEEILSKAKEKIKEAILKRIVAMSTGWGTLIKVVEAAPDLANLVFGIKGLIEDSWKYDTEDSYFFVDEKGETLVLPPWPQQAWTITYMDDSDIELRTRKDGSITLSSGGQLIVIDPATGVLQRRYEVIGIDLVAFNGKGDQLWRSRFKGLANFRIKDLTPKGHPILESSFFLFGSTLEVFNKDTGAAIGQLPGRYSIGESIWQLSGSNVSIYDADTLALRTTVQIPFVGRRLTRKANQPGTDTVAIGDQGESVKIDASGNVSAITSDGLLSDSGSLINTNDGCSGPIFRQDGKLRSIDTAGKLRWIFRSQDRDDVTKWHFDEKCNIYVGNDDGRIWFIDKNAKNIWSEEGQTLRNRLSPISDITVVGNTLLVGSGSERELFALDASSGQDLWRLPLDAGVTSILSLGTYVIFALSNGQVKRLNTIPTQQTP